LIDPLGVNAFPNEAFVNALNLVEVIMQANYGGDTIIPTTLGLLTKLTKLSLDDSWDYSTSPPVPTFFGNLVNLVELNLNSEGFEGMYKLYNNTNK